MILTSHHHFWTFADPVEWVKGKVNEISIYLNRNVVQSSESNNTQTCITRHIIVWNEVQVVHED